MANELFRAGMDGLQGAAPAVGGPAPGAFGVTPAAPSGAAVPPPGAATALPSTAPTLPSATPVSSPAAPALPASASPYLSSGPSHPSAATPFPGAVPGPPSAAPAFPSATPRVPSAGTAFPSATPGLPSAAPGLPSAGPGFPSAAPGLPTATPGFPFPAPASPPGAPALPSAAPGLPAGGAIPGLSAADLALVDGASLSLAQLGLAASGPSALVVPGGSLYVLDEAPPSVAGHGRPVPGTTPGHTTVPDHPAFDADRVRRDFPILSELVHGKPLVWLDNAATTQKPLAVIERLEYFYRHENSNIHRAAHTLAARATDAMEAARDTAARFLGAPSSADIVFVRGATEAINLVAQSWGRANLGPGDEILVTCLEHHANIVPWQMLCQVTGAELRVAPVDDDGQVLLGEYERLLGPRTKLVSFSQVSNALGTITPAREMVQMARRHGARVLVDGAQAVSHLAVDVQELDCDWYVFSGHKVFGPTGIGVLYGRAEVLDAMEPWQGGGNMIRDVTFERSLYQDRPFKLEAGTGNIADAVGLATAIDYVEHLGLDNIARHEHELLVEATARLQALPGVHLVGTAPDKAGVLSFVVDGHEPLAVGKALDREGIAVRAGHHCAQPILRRFGHEGTVRASLALYNTRADVDALIDAMRRIVSRSVQV
ncbi:family 2A encapsulin nanocompartment cargo protein cysteine desulfurase [Patulibacter sp. NPDC049589]|uniref:family 2A encapsulin nanocompartment cargo protein cysteine desulfurase n=1 Tax=Patulibacter sp. NPDC049589 TaxID=3154731 RepID=UPI0034225AE3